jgi:hypothetical protein
LAISPLVVKSISCPADLTLANLMYIPARSEWVTSPSEKLLNGYEHRLQVLKTHRVNIVRFVEQIDQGLA